MKTPSFLARTPIDSPNRSGFHIPYENMFTGRTGTLYPVFVKECIPNETHSLDMMFEAELPPMVSNFFGRVDLVFEAFFCPMSLLWKGWEYFAMHPTSNPVYPEGTPIDVKPRQIPHITSQNFTSNPFGRGTLGDFLGIKSVQWPTPAGSPSPSWNVLPFACYHRIWDDWYRNTLVQAPVFYPPRITSSSASTTAANLPFLTFTAAADDGTVLNFSTNTSAGILSSSLGDGLGLYDLRQRNWNLDYFTAATPQPQAGGASSITFEVVSDVNTALNKATGAGSVTIAAIRQANAIQKWMERNNLVGYDYADQVYAQYGCYPDNRLLRKPIYLGRYIEPVYNRSVFQSTPFGDSSDSSKNPFASVGNGVGLRSGSSQSNGKGSLFNNFTSTDHGFLMVMCSLRPHAYYSTGTNRMLRRRQIGDIAFPLLSGVGDQAIYQSELTGDASGASSSVFGYIDQYADYKTSVDEVHGLLVDGSPLDAFVLQRSFSYTDNISISSAFLQIPQDYLDQVKQVSSSAVPVDYWASCFFDYKKISPLPVYSVPTLGDLKNAHTEYVRRGGSRL